MSDFMNHNFNVTQIKLACHVLNGKGAPFHSNRSSHGLAFHTGGDKCYVFEDGKRVSVGKNKLIYLPKGSTYEVIKLKDGDCYAINFEISDDVQFSPFSMTLKNAERIIELFKKGQRVWAQRKPTAEMECKAVLYQILCILQQEASEAYIPDKKRNLITPAVEYIHKQYTSDPLYISHLSELCGITPEYFRRIFKSLYGVSPLVYINRLRLKNAKELIESGMYTVTEAAEASGYTDMSHFSRTFKKEFGFCAKDLIL